MQGRLPRSLYNFEEALAQNPMYIEHGKYASHLERFLEFFDRSAIHIVLIDDLASKPEEYLRQIHKFLGIDDTFFPAIARGKTNVSRIYRNPGLERFIRNCSDFFRKFSENRLLE
jgi:hypothetical protein